MRCGGTPSAQRTVVRQLLEREEALMRIVGGLDVHRRQITFDYLDEHSGQSRRGRIAPADRMLQVLLGHRGGRARRLAQAGEATRRAQGSVKLYRPRPTRVKSA
jgi:hypothetical protein